MRTPLIMGNWKANGSVAFVREIGQHLTQHFLLEPSVDCAIFPSFPYLSDVHRALLGSGIGLGAQNLCEHGAGAYTGEVSGAMLAEMGCGFVLLGHSERRQLFGETSADVAEKLVQAKSARLTPVLCLGETLEQREADKTEAVVAKQLSTVLEHVGVDVFVGTVIAYEPVWAIGTGLAATPEQAQAVHAFLRSLLAKHSETLANSTKIVYGGSVKPTNAAELFAFEDIDGALVGGASLSAIDFIQIYLAAV